MLKKSVPLLLILILILGCSASQEPAQPSASKPESRKEINKVLRLGCKDISSDSNLAKITGMNLEEFNFVEIRHYEGLSDDELRKCC